MKKKLFAFLTAVTCMAVNLSALSASAAIVISVSDETGGLTTSGTLVSNKEFEEYSGQEISLKYGDCFDISGADDIIINPMFPSHYYFYKADGTPATPVYHYLGTVSDIYETKELTVTGLQRGRIDLEDADKTPYFYCYFPREMLDERTSVQGLSYPEELNPENFKIGDKFLCAVDYDEYDGNYVVLPIEVTERAQSAQNLPDTSATIGDADGNGQLDVLDVILVNKSIFGKAELSEEAVKLIDFNQNGKPDSEDALTMMRKIVGLE